MSICHKSVFRRNDWTDRAGFGMEATCAAPCVIKKFRYLHKIRVLPSGSLF